MLLSHFFSIQFGRAKVRSQKTNCEEAKMSRSNTADGRLELNFDGRTDNDYREYRSSSTSSAPEQQTWKQQQETKSSNSSGSVGRDNSGTLINERKGDDCYSDKTGAAQRSQEAPSEEEDATNKLEVELPADGAQSLNEAAAILHQKVDRKQKEQEQGNQSAVYSSKQGESSGSRSSKSWFSKKFGTLRS